MKLIIYPLAKVAGLAAYTAGKKTESNEPSDILFKCSRIKRLKNYLRQTNETCRWRIILYIAFGSNSFDFITSIVSFF